MFVFDMFEVFKLRENIDLFFERLPVEVHHLLVVGFGEYNNFTAVPGI
jgi:hypothetical protein